VRVLAVIHGDQVRSGVFGDVVRERGHELEEWSLAWGTPLDRPLDSFGAVLIFGGSMHADQDQRHPWLRRENLFIQSLLDRRTPLLGVCLGAQLIAKAAHATVGPSSEPEIGWVEVELTEEAADDPVFGASDVRVAPALSYSGSSKPMILLLSSKRRSRKPPRPDCSDRSGRPASFHCSSSSCC